MSIGRKDYAKRRESRIERLENHAISAQAESTAAYEAAHSIMKYIPPGQPILVGHHSERHHRRDLDRIDRNMRKSVEADEKASYYAARAEAVVNNNAISSDDPEAVEKLQAKLEGLQAGQTMMKAINAYYRKHKTLDNCSDLSPELRQKIENSWSKGWYVGIPFPPYALSNNNAEINRIKKRLEALRKVDKMEHTEIEFEGGVIVTNEDINRVQIIFDNKPDEAVRRELKNWGFRWSPREEAWQVQRTPVYLHRAKRICHVCPEKI